MTETRKRAIHKLLEGIETGDPDAVTVVDEAKYIQHNPQTHEGSEGLAALFARLAKMNPRVNLVRVFSDGDYVFAHTEYDFSTRRIGFEVFRFEGDRAVEHWDNIQPRLGPNAAGRSMVDGVTEAAPGEDTEATRTLCTRFVEEVLIARDHRRLADFIHDDFLDHHPGYSGDLEGWTSALVAEDAGAPIITYSKLHRVLADGDFALTVSEGYLAGAHTSFYNLLRVSGGRIIERWNTTEEVPPLSEWKNDNGKF